MKLSEYIFSISKQGQHCFTVDAALQATQLSKPALLAAIRRLQSKGEVAQPYRGFYLILPPQYHAYSCLPAEQFVPDLMNYLKLPYYAGILSAAQYHGAAHQKAQVFQVVTQKYLSPIQCGKIHIVFIVNKQIDLTPTEKINTATGYLRISTAEATAIDLMQYPLRSGGINNITTTLVELVECMSPEKFKYCLENMKPDIVTLQRLGYCLEIVESFSLTNILQTYLKKFKLRTRPLVAGISTKASKRNKKWELFINYNVEPDL